MYSIKAGSCPPPSINKPDQSQHPEHNILPTNTNKFMNTFGKPVQARTFLEPSQSTTGTFSLLREYLELQCEKEIKDAISKVGGVNNSSEAQLVNSKTGKNIRPVSTIPQLSLQISFRD
jgi:hypothetical protein